jgi:hypothetical protein
MGWCGENSVFPLDILIMDELLKTSKVLGEAF